MKQILSILFFCMIIISCKKSSNEGDYYTVTGLILDWDAHSPIASAKVYGGDMFYNPATLDSTISDANGKVSFRFKKDGSNKSLRASKLGYIQPSYTIFTRPPTGINRTDTLYIARQSSLSINVHRINTYQVTDSIRLIISGYPYSSPWSQLGYYEFMRLANAPDTSLLLSFVYYPAPNHKVSLTWNVLRNRSIISMQKDSTDLIQFSIKNYNLNY